MKEALIKKYRTIELDVEVVENDYGSYAIVKDRKTGSSVCVSPDIGSGLMVDPNSPDQLEKTLKEVIRELTPPTTTKGDE